MFWLLQHGAEAETAAESGAHATEAAAHHTPPLVEFVNHYIGEPVHHFQLKYTKPLWDKFFANFGTTAESVFGEYTAENAVPWYTVMFILACIISVTLIWILKGRLSEDEPGGGQQTLEVAVLQIRSMLADVVGEHGLKYFPVVMTFAVLILVSNLMGLLPGLMSPTAATSVTFALGISSFVYYNYIGVKENGLFGHLKHFAGPIWWIAPLLFLIEIIGNLVRPMSLGIRLFGNLYADEQVAATIAGLAPPYTQFFVPVVLMPLGLFVAFIQTFVFTLLSMVYLSEVSHPPHEEHAGHGHDHTHEANVVVPA
ncbi:MAG: F0F1 ATP synthase subunit A [Pyrinomonadaceae bacterium]